jgi:FkbM family methyltransferase
VASRFKVRAYEGIKQQLMRVLPRDSRLFRLARFYVDYYRGEANDWRETNGEFELLRYAMPHCRIVFDVGANRGEWSAQAHRLNPQARIYAFEPAAATFRELAARFDPRSVSALPVALGSTTGTTTFYVDPRSSGTNSLYGERSWSESPGSTQPETIRIATVDDFCAKAGIDRIDFLKIDVEGAEIEVLRGAAGMLAAGKIGAIQFEHSYWAIHSLVMMRELFDLLPPLGFRLFKLMSMADPPVQEHAVYHPDLESFRLQNWLALQPEIATRWFGDRGLR